VDAAIDPTREMHAEEWERGVGDRVDHVLHELLATWHEFVVLAPKRHDAQDGRAG
jgi:hypothetical protein